MPSSAFHFPLSPPPPPPLPFFSFFFSSFDLVVVVNHFSFLFSLFPLFFFILFFFSSSFDLVVVVNHFSFLFSLSPPPPPPPPPPPFWDGVCVGGGYLCFSGCCGCVKYTLRCSMVTVDSLVLVMIVIDCVCKRKAGCILNSKSDFHFRFDVLSFAPLLAHMHDEQMKLKADCLKPRLARESVSPALSPATEMQL